MNRILIFLATISSLTARGQQILKTNLSGKQERILFGVNFSPDFCFRALKSTGGGLSSELILNSRNNFEIAKFGYTTGLNVLINLKEHIGLETAIQYSSKGYQTKERMLIQEQPDPNSPTKAKFVSRYYYIDIPLRVNFTVGKRKVRFFSSVGLTTNILVRVTQTAILKYPNGASKKENQTITSGYRKLNLSPMIALGVNYRMRDHMNLRVEPTFRYGLLKINDESVKAYLWNAGLNVGIYYALK